jgi:hypothetical protein
MEIRYFKSAKEITPEIGSVIVGTKENQMKRSKKGNIIIKSNIEDGKIPDCLNDWQEMTKEEVIDDFLKEEWLIKIPF